MNRTGQAKLEAVERRRVELLGVAFFVLLAASVALVALSFAGVTDGWFDAVGGTVTTVRVSVLVISVAFVAYVVEKERQLRRVTRELMDERVLNSALDARLRQILAITDAGRRIVTKLDVEDVMSLILEAVSDLLDADEGSLMLTDGDELVVAAVEGHDPLVVGQRVSLDEGISGRVARSGRALLVQSDDRGLGGALRRPDEIGSAMSVPLQVDGDVVGVLNLNATASGRRYDEQDLRAVEMFAAHAATGLRNARLLRRERLRTEAMQSGRHIGERPQL